MTKFASVDDYVDSFDGIPRERVTEMRGIIKKILQKSEERISYNIPAYFVDGQMVVYFAGYAKHIGMYPGRTGSDAYNKLSAKYAHGKSTAQFPHDEPLPKDIIEKFIKVRLDEIGKS